MTLALGFLSGALLCEACNEACRGNSWKTLCAVALFAFFAGLTLEVW